MDRIAGMHDFVKSRGANLDHLGATGRTEKFSDADKERIRANMITIGYSNPSIQSPSLVGPQQHAKLQRQQIADQQRIPLDSAQWPKNTKAPYLALQTSNEVESVFDEPEVSVKPEQGTASKLATSGDIFDTDTEAIDDTSILSDYPASRHRPKQHQTAARSIDGVDLTSEHFDRLDSVSLNCGSPGQFDSKTGGANPSAGGLLLEAGSPKSSQRSTNSRGGPETQELVSGDSSCYLMLAKSDAHNQQSAISPSPRRLHATRRDLALRETSTPPQNTFGQSRPRTQKQNSGQLNDQGIEETAREHDARQHRGSFRKRPLQKADSKHSKRSDKGDMDGFSTQKRPLPTYHEPGEPLASRNPSRRMDFRTPMHPPGIPQKQSDNTHSLEGHGDEKETRLLDPTGSGFDRTDDFDEGDLSADGSAEYGNDLDYEIDELKGMAYDELRQEPFDHIPRKIGATGDNTSADAHASLDERLETLFALRKGQEAGNLPEDFFTALESKDFEECGDLLLGKFGGLIEKFKESRRKKRAVAAEMEEEVSRRQEVVSGRMAVMEGDLRRLKKDGLNVVRKKAT